MKRMAVYDSNETTFKNGISLVDEIDFIRVKNLKEKKEVLEAFKKHKMTTLPDGRKVKDIIAIRGVPKGALINATK